jgi:hypothetical protein
MSLPFFRGRPRAIRQKEPDGRGKVITHTTRRKNAGRNRIEMVTGQAAAALGSVPSGLRASDCSAVEPTDAAGGASNPPRPTVAAI